MADSERFVMTSNTCFGMGAGLPSSFCCALGPFAFMRRWMLCATGDSLIGLEKDPDPPCTFVSTAGDRTIAVDLLSPIFLLGCVVRLTLGETIMAVLALHPSLTNDLIRLLP